MISILYAQNTFLTMIKSLFTIKGAEYEDLQMIGNSQDFIKNLFEIKNFIDVTYGSSGELKIVELT